jgi:D-tyrosyl-tRNA(Tyr) deacylase
LNIVRSSFIILKFIFYTQAIVVRLILQRVLQARVTVEGREIAKIGSGLLILLGIGHADTETEADFLAEKCAHLRIFADAEGKTNLSIRDKGGEALVVSQFTLYADSRKGRRPSFTDAAAPDQAERLVDYFAGQLANDGPFTVILESPLISNH